MSLELHAARSFVAFVDSADDLVCLFLSVNNIILDDVQFARLGSSVNLQDAPSGVK